MDGVTLGTPIAFVVRNSDCCPNDYDALRDCFRPGHADYTYQQKYGIRDHRGGGGGYRSNDRYEEVPEPTEEEINAAEDITVEATD